MTEDRQNTISEFAKWMLEDPSDEAVSWVTDIANMTPGTTASMLNATGFYLDYSSDLAEMEGTIPLLYILREEWQPQADPWISANTPTARTIYLGKHMMFWERPDAFNTVLDDFLSQY